MPQTNSGAPPSRWYVGPRVWRVAGEWRLRLYRPWRAARLIESQSASFLAALAALVAGAGWWRPR